MSNDTTSLGPNPSGLCMCGCGGKTLPAQNTNANRGTVRGRPQRYIFNHHRRSVGPEYVITESGCDIDRIAWRVVMKVREMQARIDAFIEIAGLKEAAEALEEVMP